ncbi:hypothetical protein ASD00_19575 [Ensifer sp. Root31]|nr:hypothetical protein ASD00_19575 [Ensifer sp. Root31]
MIKGPHERIDRRNGLTVPVDDDVSLQDPTNSTGSIGVNTHDHRPLAATGNGDRMEPEAEIATRDFAMCGFRQSPDRVSGNLRTPFSVIPGQ